MKHLLLHAVCLAWLAWLGLWAPSGAAEAVAPAAGACRAAEECYGAGLEAGMAERFDEALRLLGRAVALDPHLSEADAVRRAVDAAARGATEPQGVVHLCRGASYFGTGRFEEALGEFSAAVARDSGSAISHYYRGLAYAAARRDREKAIASLSRAIELDPTHDKPFASRGQLYVQQRDYGRARLDFDRALELNPRHAPAWVGRADVCAEKGDPEGALRAYGEALAVDARSVEALRGRAALFVARNELSKALGDLDALLQIDERHEDALLARARVYADLADMEMALESASAAVAATDSAQAYRARADLQQRAGDHRRAVADLEKARVRDDKDSWTLRALGESLEALGEEDRAWDAYDEAVRLDRRDAKALFLRASLRIKRRQLEGAMEDLTRVVDVDAGYGAAYSARSAVAYVLGDYQRSADDAKRATALLPLDARGHVLLGRALLKLGRAAEAKAALQTATGLEAREPFADYYLGLACESLSQFGEAAEALRRALQLNPRDASAHLHLGNVRLRTKAFPQAVEAYRRSLDLKPDQHEAYRGLAEASRRLGRTEEAQEFDDEADRIERERVLRTMNTSRGRPESAVQ